MSEKKHELIGNILVNAGNLTPNDLEKSIEVQQQVGGMIGTILVRMGAISEGNLLDALCKQNDWQLLESTDVQHVIEHQPPEDFPMPTIQWLKDRQVYLWLEDDTLCVVCKNPKDSLVHQTISLFYQSRQVVWHIASSRVLELIWGKFSDIELNATVLERKGDLRRLAEEAPVIDKVDDIFSFAVMYQASDIHIEPEQNECVVRFRVDGVLQEYARFPVGLFDAISSRVKLISGMDIAEKRRPQDGRIAKKIRADEYDVRVSSAPSVHGESIVMRLLKKQNSIASIDNLGLSQFDRTVIDQWLSHPHGLILVTGPTGSGKSTTLYASLKEITDGKKKIITVEDPVEYQVDGITQIQANSEIGYDFARALRAILRQDPDVIMIGEVRDVETAKIAIQSALTGHLVFSTLHTNDAVGAFARLIDMGVEPFLVAAPMVGVQAQRLVRRVCPHCAVESKVPEEYLAECRPLMDKFGIENPSWKIANGCDECNGTGFSGRLGVYEFITVDEKMRDMIGQGATSDDIRRYAKEQSINSIVQDGILKVLQGHTVYSEIVRVRDNL